MLVLSVEFGVLQMAYIDGPLVLIHDPTSPLLHVNYSIHGSSNSQRSPLRLCTHMLPLVFLLPL